MDHLGHGHRIQLLESASFDEVRPHDKNGKVEHWDSELLTNPSALARAGWTKSRSVEALKPGTTVKLYIGTSRVGGFSGIVMKIENEKGENVVGERGDVTGGRHGRRSRWLAAERGRQEGVIGDDQE